MVRILHLKYSTFHMKKPKREKLVNSNLNSQHEVWLQEQKTAIVENRFTVLVQMIRTEKYFIVKFVGHLTKPAVKR